MADDKPESGGTGSGDQGANSGGTGSGQNDQNNGGAGNGQQGGGSNSGGTGADDAAKRIELLTSQLAQARDDAAKARTTGKQTAAQEAEAALLGKLTKALGLAQDQAPDPEKLAADLAKATEDHRSALVELQVLKVAGGEKGDPVALLDSRAFLASIKDLDPKAEGFGDQVKAAIAKAVKDNPRLGAGTSVGAGGGQIDGGTKDKGDDGELSDAELDKLAKRGRTFGLR